jgi:hypothetical protein
MFPSPSPRAKPVMMSISVVALAFDLFVLFYQSLTDKKENQNFPIYKEIQDGAVAKS